MKPLKQDAATLLHKLAHAGIPVDGSAIEPELEIEQLGGVYDSKVLEMESGLLAYVFEIGITNQTSQAIRCFDLELRLPYTDDRFYWLGDPRFEDPVERYWIPGTGLIYGRDQVLNHVLLGDGILHPGALKKGLLLAIGASQRAGLRHGAFIDATLVFIDNKRTEHSAIVNLWVDRSASLERNMRPKSTREGLFAREHGVVLRRVSNPSNAHYDKSGATRGATGPVSFEGWDAGADAH